MTKKYRTICADPPLPYDGFASGYNGKNGIRRWDVPVPYETLTLAEIRNLPIVDLAERDARLFLWTTNKYLPAAFGVIDAWGFTYAQTIVWHKSNHPTPFVTSIAIQATEYLLYAKRGAPGRVTQPFPSTCIKTHRPRKASHSRKPEMFLDLIEQVGDPPYLELFARRARFGWDYFGNESLGTADMPGAASPAEEETE